MGTPADGWRFQIGPIACASRSQRTGRRTPPAGDQASKNVVSFQRGTSCCGSPKWSAVGGTSSGLVTGSRPSPAMALMACSLVLLTLASLKYTAYTSGHDDCKRPGADRAGYARTQPDASPLRAE